MRIMHGELCRKSSIFGNGLTGATKIVARSDMSALMQALRARFLGRDECRVIVVGLDGCGKTTIVHRLKHGALDDSEIIPTVGFNVECVEHKKMIFSLWDLGGAQDARTFWRFYYPDTQAVIFVIDSSDVNRMVRFRHRIPGCCDPLSSHCCALLRSRYLLWRRTRLARIFIAC